MQSRPPWTDRPPVLAWRERLPALDAGAEVLDGFRRHRTGRNAALVAHYGFLSVFPLLVVLTTILGFVLESRPELQADIIDSALNNLPFIGEQLERDPSRIDGNVVVLIAGLIGALWGGMKAFVAVQAALDDIHEIPLAQRSGYVHTRIRAVGGIVVIGGAQVATAISTALAGVAEVGVASRLLLVVGAVLVNTIVLAATYLWLCSVREPWRTVLPGAITGGVLFAGFQLLGTVIVGRAIANASHVYGNFAAVIGLLTWLSLHAVVALAGAELNGVLARLRSSSVAAQPSPGCSATTSASMSTPSDAQ